MTPSFSVLEAEERLRAVLHRYGDLAIAVSGGVDSMTLATLAHRFLSAPPLMVHATSPAVPGDALAIVRSHAEAEGWDLRLLAAGEFDDPDYRANPQNRCYFCKSNLYGSIAAMTERTIASGTNRDDLGDYRPGLKAADEHRVVHPFVEAGIDKAAIRALARHHGLHGFSEAPAQPCLASRIETGIRIDEADLRFVDTLEAALRALAGPQAVVRVRIRPRGVSVELGETVPQSLQDAVADEARRFCQTHDRPFLGVVPYRQGSAFIGKKTA